MNSKNNKIIPVILCGGSGTRLWPLSRQNSPKQFLCIDGDETLLHKTIKRALQCADANPADIITVTTDHLMEKTYQQLADISYDATRHLICEPSARNTSAAIGYAALYAQKHFGNDATLWIIGADYHIENEEALSQALFEAVETSKDSHLVTFGIKPSYAETGYGYIKMGDAINADSNSFEIDSFEEKPNKETAQSYLEQDNYLWNSGMFVFSVQSVIENFICHAPETIIALKHAMKMMHGQSVPIELYNKIPSVPFDVSIMEKTHKSAVIPCDIGWSDIGSWESVWALSQKDENGNASKGRVINVDSENCLIESTNLLITTVGLKDIIAIEYADSILIADKNNNQSIKTLVNKLKLIDAPEAIISPLETRPWGRYKTLSSNPNYIVRELTIKPGEKMALHMHEQRSESWTVISGKAFIMVENQQHILEEQDSISAAANVAHSIENRGTEDLILIETQTGNYLGEDDMVHIGDMYGRAVA